MNSTLGIQNFGEVRRDGYGYVDKTALMYKMVSEGKYYFLSRPRRFGKSLLLSTLEAFFQGERELFHGLAVERLETEWVKHPILHLDLNSREYKDESSLAVSQFVKDVCSGDAESFMHRLQDFFAGGDYQAVGNTEKYFQNTLYVFFRLLGFYVNVERHTTGGRMDVLIQTQDYIYILELKVNQTAAAGLQQIEDKGYALPFASDPRRLFKIGINFATDTKLIDDWKIA